MMAKDAISGEWQFPGNDKFEVTQDMTDFWHTNGFIILRGFLSSDEIQHVKVAVEHPEGVRTKVYGLDDGVGRMNGFVIWSHPGKDVTGVFSRMKKMVDTSSKLLEDEVYHYHTKMVMKAPRTGGQFTWHQDYGYWYSNGCLFPDMNTCYLAIDKADEENGCLEILPGSHRVGRIDHFMRGGLRHANTERVEHLRTLFPLKTLPLDPGDLIIFHCNLLHRSAPNNSDRRRWSLLVTYNTKSNNPVKKHHHAQYTPIDVVPNRALLQCTNITDLSGKEFNTPEKDETVNYEKDKQEAMRGDYLRDHGPKA